SRLSWRREFERRVSCPPSLSRGLRLANASRLRRFLRKRRLRGVAHFHPAALGARHRTTDKQKPAIGIDADDLQILSRDAFVAQVASHLLTLEDLARILTLARRTMRTVRNRDAVRGAQTAEIPALHRAGETLTDRNARDVDLLADNKMVGANFGADRQKVVLGDAELAHDRFRLYFRARELTALGLRRALRLGGASAE